jgi:hypothetical protein
MREYCVKASTMSGTYNAGRFVASSPEEAKEMAREAYRNSPIGREFKDVGAFRFWIATDFND